MFKERTEGYVPSWDGTSKSWRRYVKEISWYVGSTKRNQRQYIASKLISRLSGSARLLAMSWSQREFEGEEGVALLLRRFAASPLVRRSLPNAAAIMSEYFSFKRKLGEGISQFLVRETLGFEEFSEALVQLKEERDGVDPSTRVFDLPPMSPTDERSGYTDHRTGWPSWRDWQPPRASDAQSSAHPEAEEGYAEVPQRDPDSPPRQDGGSPGHQDPQIPGVLGPLDSFILDVLRGWRLLVAASLSNEEWRDVLAATGNKLDYLSVSDALQTLWDEQLGSSRNVFATGRGSMQSNFHEQFESPYAAAYDAYYSHWSDDARRWDEWSGWDDGNAYQAEQSGTPWTSMASPDDGALAVAEGDPDPDLLEAIESEKAAEALMVDARRTWSQAQQATSLLRKDRGFGKAGSASSSGNGNPRGCFICGSPQHGYKDCPDRGFPSKGRGKFMSPVELDAYLMSGKGKGKKGFGKSKDSQWFEESVPFEAHWMSKGKSGKGYGKPKGKFSTVNVYGMDFYGLEISFDSPFVDPKLSCGSFDSSFDVFPLELYAAADSCRTTSPSVPIGCGMLDCGATASAGPEASVKRLLAKLRKVDPAVQVFLDSDKRPFFRYGSGKWGQALYHLTVTSSKGAQRSFSIYALPNPPDYGQPWFTDDMLVPILVGMDHLSKVGLILDFCDGHAVYARDPDSTPFNMPKNVKGHFMVDIEQYLFSSGAHDSEVSNAFALQQEPAEAPGLENDGKEESWLELGTFEVGSPSEVPHQIFGVQQESHVRSSDDFFQYMLQRRRKLQDPVACISSQDSDPVSSFEPSPVTNAKVTNQDRSSSGSHSGERLGLEGPQVKGHMLAMLRRAQGLRDRVQRLWELERLRELRPSVLLHPENGISRTPYSSGRSSHGGDGFEHAEVRSQESQRLQGPHGETGTLHHRDSGKEREAGARDEQDRGTHDFIDASVSQLEDRQDFKLQGYQSSRSPGHFVSDDSRGGEPSQESGGPEEAGDGRSRRGADPCSKSSSNVAHPTPQIEDSTKKVDFSAVVECVELPSVGSSDEETLQDSVVPEDLHDYSAFEMMHSCSSLTQKTDCQTKSQKPKKKNSTMNRSLKENHQKQKKKNSAALQSQNDNEEFFEDYSAFRSGSSTTNALPWSVAKALLAMMTLLTATANENLRNLVRGNQVDVWEMLCSPYSFLTQACESEGLHCSRINLDNHYDLYRRQTYDTLFEKVKKERPKRFWVSTRCTYWCPWTSLNYNTEEKWAKLEGYRRKERGMFRLLFPFLESALIEDDSADLFMEWPTRCQGWNEPLFLNFQARLQQAGRPLWFCRIDGCRYGLRSSSGGFLKKSWTIATTSQTFYHLYKMKTCVGNHAHDHIQGIETARSAYYPWRMVKSIAQTWRKELFPERRLSLLHAPLPQHHSCAALDLHAGELVDEDQDEVGGEQDNVPTQREREQWMVQLKKYHRASGHPNNFNLARILRDAGLEKWKVDAASSLHCDECAALKLGGDSSGKIPPASMRPMPKAWEVVGMDCTEWNPPGTKKKLKILVMMDLATRFKVTSTLLTYELYEMKHESTDQLLHAFCSRWLADKPKPLVLVPDNAKSMTSAHMRQVLADLNIQIDPPAAKESWAHGLMERAVQETKNVANKIHLANPSLDPLTSLALATHAMNATEHVSGFTPLQWVYGKQFIFSEEDERVISQMILKLVTEISHSSWLQGLKRKMWQERSELNKL